LGFLEEKRRHMRIGIVGGGISGLPTAYLLSEDHEITLFEANTYLGGHANTVDVAMAGVTWPVDTGFIFFYLWVAYRVSGVVARIAWFVLIMALGNIAMARYLLLQLRRLKPGDGVPWLLLNREAP
jgi:glycine/D-amino acid oxidase-like deaminating enzyme